MFDRVGAKDRARGIMRQDLSACVGAYMFSILLSLAPFSAPASSIGLWRYNLDVVRGGRPRASKVLRGYDSFSRALALRLWNMLFIALWQLPGVALYLIGAIIGGVGITNSMLYGGGGGGAAVVMIIMAIIAGLWIIFISIYKNSQYMFSFAILADRPELTAKQCLDASVELSTPYIGSIIIAKLSFIGWLLLSIITEAIAGMLYVFPYMNLTWALIYCQIVPREQWGNSGGADNLDAVKPQAPSGISQSVNSFSMASEGMIRGVAGYYTGYKFQIKDGETINIGRDSKMAQIVFADSEDSKKISRLHCSISYSAVRGAYTITDRSSNGTFRADGSQLPPNTPLELPRGTTIYLGSPNNSFTLD